MEREAAAFFASLRDDQRSRCWFSIEDESARRDWDYRPRTRPGLALDDMSVEQQKLAMQLLGSGLSVQGFATATVIMALEDVLDSIEGGHRFRHRGDYSVSLFNKPGDDEWGWRFEGHHLSVNVTVIGGEVVAQTPLFFGANPASVGTVRPLAPEEDVGRALATAVGRACVIADDAPVDILTTWQPRVGDRVKPEGVAVSSLSGEASALAGELVAVYLERIPEERRPAFSSLGDLHFAWAGPLERGEGHYYRLQAERFLAEYDNTQNGANHIHTVVRDAANDFGEDALRRHRAERHPEPD